VPPHRYPGRLYFFLLSLFIFTIISIFIFLFICAHYARHPGSLGCLFLFVVYLCLILIIFVSIIRATPPSPLTAPSSRRQKKRGGKEKLKSPLTMFGKYTRALILSMYREIP